MKKLLNVLMAGAALLLGVNTLAVAEELGIDDPLRASYYEAFKDKKVIFIPVAMGFDLTEGWYHGMKQELEPLGVTVELRDPNWSTDAGARAITSVISEKPDVLVVHNPDVQTYARLLQKAEKNGVKVVQVNMKSAFPTEAFVGADWVEIGEKAAEAVVAKCGEGTSGKVAIMQGVPTAAASAYQIRGVSNVFNKHPNIKIVSNQAGDWDASKARSITETTLQQHPDLCGIIGFWDGMDSGTGAAVKEAGKADDIFIVSSGSGGKPGCDMVTNDILDMNISYDVPAQARDISNVIRGMMQSKKPGEKITLFTKLQLLTKETMEKYKSFGACWLVDDLKTQ